MTPEPVIACTLGAGDVRARMAWIAELNGRGLKRHAREDLRLTLVYDAAFADDVAKLVAQERDCCGFLTFEVVRTPDEVTVLVSAPEAARGAAPTLFDGFVGGRASSCGCC